MEKTIGQKLKETEAFFKDAFCAEGATVLQPSATKNFKITGVIEIQTTDKRGVIYVAAVEKI